MSNQRPPFDFDDPQQPIHPYPPQGNPLGQQSTDPFGNPVNPYSPFVTTPPPPRRFSGCLILFIIGMACCLPAGIVGVVLLTVGGAMADLGGIDSLDDLGAIISDVVSELSGPATQAITGDPANFDPLVGLDQAQAFAGPDAKFAAMTARYVRRDGTMDLTASYNASTTYDFVLPIDPPEDAPPVGAAGNTGGQWYLPISIEAYRPGQMSTITSTGGGVSTRIQFVNQGMRRDDGDPTTSPFDLPAPPMQCTLVELWERAIDEGAPPDAVAIIDYSSFGDRWEYDFSISGWSSISFDVNCRLS
jgi:hypothetical protein